MPVKMVIQKDFENTGFQLRGNDGEWCKKSFSTACILLTLESFLVLSPNLGYLRKIEIEKRQPLNSPLAEGGGRNRYGYCITHLTLPHQGGGDLWKSSISIFRLSILCCKKMYLQLK